MLEIVIASSNEGKIKEIKNTLKGFTISYMKDYSNMPKDIAETGDSFLENALIKARAVYRVAKKPTLAEDSGLIVDALNGEPGIKSARYGAKNGNEKLDPKDINKLILAKMLNIPKGSKRRACYEAFIVLMFSLDDYLVTSGKCFGEIAMEPRGTSGFGFDDIFYLPQYNKTAAQISMEQKDKISHRGIALRKLKEKLRVYLQNLS